MEITFYDTRTRGDSPLTDPGLLLRFLIYIFCYNLLLIEYYMKCYYILCSVQGESAPKIHNTRLVYALYDLFLVIIELGLKYIDIGERICHQNDPLNIRMYSNSVYCLKFIR